MSNEVFPIQDLPEEVLEHIFSFLPLSNRKSASLVCAKWERLAFYRRFLRKVVLRIQLEFTCQVQVQFLRRSKRRYRNVLVFLHTHGCSEFCFQNILAILELFGADVESLQCMGHLNTNQLCMVLSLLPKLQHLIVRLNFDDEYVYPGFEIPPLKPLEEFALQIENLDVSHVNQLDIILSEPAEGRNFLPVLRRLAPQLKNLYFYSTDYFIPLEQIQFPEAEVLNIGGNLCDTDNDWVLRTFFAGFKLLKEVRLDFIIKEIVLDVIVEACPAIELLKFKSPRFNVIPFRSLGRLKYLRTLGLGEVNDVPDISLKCSPMVSVKSLSLVISNCEESSIERLRHLLPNVIDMSVTLKGDYTIDRGLRHICQNFRGLQRLKVSDKSTRFLKPCISLLELEHLDRLEELILKNIRTRIVNMPPNPHLKRFVLKSLCWLFDRDMLELARQFPNLRCFEHGRNVQLSSQAIDVLKSQLVNCAVHCIPYAMNSVSKNYRDLFKILRQIAQN
ncbi:uncharacterized protein LOC134287637 [Aedes albopictus]|uniref:F-box domain-containing protein n=1 Tax=Aedes albopictus TaxID=7160 RepID=A0ABM1YVZ6_AEDAL